MQSARHTLRKHVVPHPSGAIGSIAGEETGANLRAQLSFNRVPEVEARIKEREIGDWDAAERSALEVLTHTDAHGRNKLFEAILTYRDAGKQETVMNALAIVEMCAAIAPWILDRASIFELATHQDFSVRSSAASICMEMARVAPDRVPVDILLRLSRYDEDWYVQAPANAALKTIAHAVPGVLRIFFDRLKSGESRRARARCESAL